MSKQDIIREELAKRRYYDGMVGVGSGIPRWEDRTDVEREHFRTKIDSDFQYLHSQGVVIKVGNKLPTISYHSAYPENEERYQQAMLDAGYVAVKSLI